MTYLYRVFDAADLLLYIGIAESFEQRLSQHEINSGWFDKAERLVVEWHTDRRSALTAEGTAIEAERPLWNRVGSPYRAAAEELVYAATPAMCGPQTPKELEALLVARLRRRFRLLRTVERRYRDTTA